MFVATHIRFFIFFTLRIAFFRLFMSLLTFRFIYLFFFFAWPKAKVYIKSFAHFENNDLNFIRFFLALFVCAIEFKTGNLLSLYFNRSSNSFDFMRICFFLLLFSTLSMLLQTCLLSQSTYECLKYTNAFIPCKQRANCNQIWARLENIFLLTFDATVIAMTTEPDNKIAEHVKIEIKEI